MKIFNDLLRKWFPENRKLKKVLYDTFEEIIKETQFINTKSAISIAYTGPAYMTTFYSNKTKITYELMISYSPVVDDDTMDIHRRCVIVCSERIDLSTLEDEETILKLIDLFSQDLLYIIELNSARIETTKKDVNSLIDNIYDFNKKENDDV